MSIGNGEAKPLYHELRLHDLIFAIFLWDGDDQIDQLVAKKFGLVFAVHALHRTRLARFVNLFQQTIH